MPTTALLLAALSFILEQTVQSAFGVTGLVGLAMFTIGVKSANVPCSCLGAFMLMLQVRAVLG
ncbi:hypothetical protein AB0M87_30060 [Streptomyces sp. NPDC051320]|uniref:hypothetical protein n=1 Tax=Streptomyces sp. NPDC051320 TaxID=3154644 RepID=UPI00342245F7